MYEKNVKIQQILKEERLKRGLTCGQFAKMIGCTTRAVTYWESEKRVITIEIADKALKALGLSVVIGKENEMSITKCPKCGNTEIGENHSFCQICGLNLKESERKAVELQRNLKRISVVCKVFTQLRRENIGFLGIWDNEVQLSKEAFVSCFNEHVKDKSF